MDCDIYNQYYSDVVIDRKIINERCFNGSEVYRDVKKFNVNGYKNYKSNEYYNWINTSFQRYAFPDEKFNDPGYDPDAVYSSICNAGDYALKPQQKFAGRIMNTFTDNKGLLIYHGLGSGKTHTSIIIGEAFKFRNVNDSINNNRADTHVLIVVPAALVDQYYSEIIGKIENGKIRSASGEILINGQRQYYLDSDTRDAISQAYLDIINLEQKIKNADDTSGITEYQRKIRILRTSILNRSKEERLNVQKVYTIISHDSFLNRVFFYKDREFTPGPYLPLLQIENGLMIIDEIQNLVSAIGTSYRKLLYAIKFYAKKKFRVVALTGTPIYDKPFEFGLLMNLLRPRMQFPDGYDDFNEIFLQDRYTMKNHELFKKMCSGYISYFKGGNPEAYPFKKTVLVHHSMNPYQYSKYKIALIDEVRRDQFPMGEPGGEAFIVRIHTTEGRNDETVTGIFNNSNLFCNIAFPEAKLSVEETKHLTRETLLKASIREFKSVLRQKIQGTFTDLYSRILNTVSTYSSKFAKVAELIMQSQGPVFVYSNYVYYGVDAMGIIMSFLGYSEFPDNSGPNGSYFVWKGKAAEESIVKAKELFNSKENVDGKLLRIMFGTQTVMEGVDFKNIRQIHILDPWWNDSRLQQVIARGIRLCSHRDLPPAERYVNVFIHLSTLGSAETMYEVNIRKMDRTGLKEVESRVRSFLKLENPDETNPSNWVFREAYITPTGELKNANATFLASKIINYTKLADPVLTKTFGHHKNLDSISVQEYMYKIAMNKLHLNRQFEKAIKEVSIDCSLNKNGNILRLNEFYSPHSIEGMYTLQYENYSNGDFYTREGLPNMFSIQDILQNIAMKSNNFTFKNVRTSEQITLNKSLILSENIICGNGEYSFENIPSKIVQLTLNKELIPQLMNLPLGVIKQYLYDVQRKVVKTSDPTLSKSINLFLNKDYLVQKKELIEKFLDLGIGEESVWELYTLDQLKKEYSRFKFKK